MSAQPEIARWRASSYSSGNGDCVEVAGAAGRPEVRERWRTSSHSNGNCVEVAARPGRIGVRDSKDRSGPVLTLGGRAWSRFLDGVRA